MGGELVNSPASRISYTEQFEKYFPFYLSIGMTYEQYWYQDCQLARHYRKAYELKNKRMNQELWLQGMYIYDALCRVSPILHAFAKGGTQPEPYPTAPYPISDREARESEHAKEKANRERAMATFGAWSKGLNLPKGE